MAGASVNSPPVIGANGVIYVGSADQNVYAIFSNGLAKWWYTTGGEVYGAPAVAADGTVYAGSMDGKLYALDASGNPVWPAFVTGGPILSSPAIATDGTIYVGSNDGRLYAVYGNAGLADTVWPMFLHDANHTGRKGGR